MKSNRHKINIKFYTKSNCSLCEKVRDLIRDFEDRYPLEIEEINILSSLSLYEKYKHTIPVVVIDDTLSFVSQVDRQRLEKKLKKVTSRINKRR